MVVRQIAIAVLFATASIANAAVVETTAAAAPQAAWSSAPVAQAAPSDAFQVMMSSPGSWTSNSRMGDRGTTATMLFSQKSFASAPQQAAALTTVAPAAAPVAAAAPAPEAAPVVAAAPAAAPAVIEAPAADVTANTTVAIDSAALVTPGVSVAADVTANVGVVAPAAVPEPATGMLMLAGLLGVGALARRRK